MVCKPLKEPSFTERKPFHLNSFEQASIKPFFDQLLLCFFIAELTNIFAQPTHKAAAFTTNIITILSILKTWGPLKLSPLPSQLKFILSCATTQETRTPFYVIDGIWAPVCALILSVCVDTDGKSGHVPAHQVAASGYVGWGIVTAYLWINQWLTCVDTDSLYWFLPQRLLLVSLRLL